MISIRIPRRAAADEPAVMGLISRRVCPLAGEYHGPWRQERAWQLDAGARWTGALADRQLILRCRDEGWPARLKEGRIALAVALRLWLGFWKPSGAPPSIGSFKLPGGSPRD
jgi:hypothetical protein